jgi:hypothetical protein
MIEVAEQELQWLLQREAEAPEWMKAYYRKIWTRLKEQVFFAVHDKHELNLEFQIDNGGLAQKCLADELFPQDTAFEAVIVEPQA